MTIGVTDQMAAWEKKRTRLLNGICFFVVLAYLGFMASYGRPDERPVFWESVQAAIIYTFPIILNYYHRHRAACHFFCIYNLVLYSYFAISHGRVDAAEYYLLTSSIASMLFFRRLSIVLTYFLLNLALFWICKYSFSVMKPFIVMPPGDEAYVPNHILLFAFAFLIVYHFKSENVRQEGLLENKNEKLAEEKLKSDNLLLNILPGKTADELKETGFSKARQYAQVTVMFTDFVNFTAVAAKLSPEQLVAVIDGYFGAFDAIIGRHNIEKIKTIGDSYMCAAGLPEEQATHASEIAHAALELREYVQSKNAVQQLNGEPYFNIRIGIHSGPVVAGIVGTKKFAYDIWGDAVNVASRMESCAQPGTINISGETYRLIAHEFTCTYRGKIAAKNRGEIDMYFLERKC